VYFPCHLLEQHLLAGLTRCHADAALFVARCLALIPDSLRAFVAPLFMVPLATYLSQPTCGGPLLNAVASYLDLDAGRAEAAEALWSTLHGVGLSLGVTF
jgi:hypothetical protein